MSEPNTDSSISTISVPTSSYSRMEVDSSFLRNVGDSVELFKKDTQKVDASNKTKIASAQANPYKSIADTQPTGFQKDQKRAQAIAASNLKHPDQAPTPALQLIAVSGKMGRIINSPTWATLPTQYRIQVLSEMYDTHVIDAFKANGIEPPEKGDWILKFAKNILSPKDWERYNKTYGEGVTRLLTPEQDKEYGATYKDDKEKDHNQNTDDRSRLSGGGVFTSAIADELDILKLTANLIRYPFNTASQAYQSPRDPIKKIADTFDRISDWASKTNTDALSAFAPQQGFNDWMNNAAGHIVGSAPAFIGIGKIGEAFKLGALTKAIVPSLAERAAMSGGFKVAVASLKNSGEVFALERGEGSNWTDSFKSAAYALAFSGALHGAILRFQGAKLGVGGRPFINDVETRADREDGAKVISRPDRLISLISDKDPDSIEALVAERNMRHQVAAQFFPDKAEKFTKVRGEQGLWNNLSKNQRLKIQAHINALTEQAGELNPITNPELTQAANQNTLEQWYKENSGEKAIDEQIEKLTGQKIAKTVTDAQAAEVGQKTGLTGKTAQLNAIYRRAQDYKERSGSNDLFGENLSRTSGLKTTSKATLLNPRLPVEDFINGTREYLEPSSGSKAVKGKEFFENPEHHLLWVANFSDAPAAIKNRSFAILRNEFNLNRDEADITKGGKAAGWLANFRNNLALTGHLDAEGNIFRSTKTKAPRFGTQWQKEVTESERPDVILKDLAKIRKSHPELRGITDDLFHKLNDVVNKSNTPLTERQRTETMIAVKDILKRFK
jgi:hypothetical protein